MRRWGVLAFYAGLLQVVGVCVGVLGFVAGVVIGLGGIAAGGGLGLGVGAYGALVAVTAVFSGLGFVALGQLLDVLMSIERNTRRPGRDDDRDLEW